LYDPVYALLYPASRVYWLIPDRYLTVDERYAIILLLPFIEFFFVALFALEVRRRVVAHIKKSQANNNG
jgi:hypothetical protein